MTLLASTLLVLELVAAPAAPKARSRPRAFEELPTAPVEIVLPSATEKPAAQEKPAAKPRIVISAPSLAKPPAPIPPPPAVPTSPAPSPALATEATGAAAAAAPKGAEVVASSSSATLPLERQPGYEVVVQKCGRCHSVEKALHARFTAGDWDAYLKKKFRRNGAGISQQQAEEISAFLRGRAIRGGRP